MNFNEDDEYKNSTSKMKNNLNNIFYNSAVESLITSRLFLYQPRRDVRLMFSTDYLQYVINSYIILLFSLHLSLLFFLLLSPSFTYPVSANTRQEKVINTG